MKSKQSLLFGQGLLTIFIIVSFGLIIINEKKVDLFSNKINKKIDDYIEEKYSSIKESLVYSDKIIEKNTIKKQLKSKENENYYFEIYYKNSKISDTYQEDFIEGKKYLDYISNKIEKEILEKTGNTCTVKPLNTLNDYAENIKNRIIQEDNLLELRFYSLEQELLIDDWNSQSITNEIINNINIYKNNNILPKYYIFIVTNKNDKSQSIEISYITNSFLDLNNPEKLIIDVLNDQNTTDLKENKIQYKYL